MSNIIKDNKEQQGETPPHNPNPTAELITLSLAAILFAVIVIVQIISIAGGLLF
jgi:hypothetical protein